MDEHDGPAAARRSGIRLVVVGASAGGVEALQRLVSQFDDPLATAVAVVLHLPAGATSLLPQILGRQSRVPASHAVDGQAIAPGHIYIAPPDVHLVVDAEEGFLLTKGPRENNHRPAIDPLFRSAADVFGPSLVGIVLSGTLDDGAAGLAAVARAGGITASQSLDDAMFSAMPRAAQSATAVDVVGTALELGRFVGTLGAPRSHGHGDLGRSRTAAATQGPAATHTRPEHQAETGDLGVTGRSSGASSAASAANASNASDASDASDASAASDQHTPSPRPEVGVAGSIGNRDEVPSTDSTRLPSRYTCPDCHGSLWELKEGGGLRRYRCRVGHAWSEGALVERQGMELENALWMAMRLIDERLELFRKMRGDASVRDLHSHSDRWLTERIEPLEHHAAVLRLVLAELPPEGTVSN
jgi:two-component system chemotaxis response regulator CheB